MRGQGTRDKGQETNYKEKSSKSLVLFLLLVPGLWSLVPGPLFAWSGYTHSLMAKESLADVAQEWGLREKVIITSFQQFLEKLSKENPNIQTREDFARWLKINPKSHFDRPSRKKEKIGQEITPLEILSLSSTRPDDHRDMHLPYDKGEQFWFGKGAKEVTQAFRHMEKPAFNLLHPLNTFGFPLGGLGQASERAQIYFDLALKAHLLKEPYWAWNFLGCALHYIEDLSQPYHAVQLLPPLAFKGIQAYFQWGRREKRGLIRTVTHITANAHHYFEGYVDHFLFENRDLGIFWQRVLKGRDVLENAPSIKNLAQTVRDFSNQSAFDTVAATFQLTGKNLLTSKPYDVWNKNLKRLEDPIPYLNPLAKERLEAASQISKIVLKEFEMEGKAIRTVIKTFLQTIREENPDV